MHECDFWLQAKKWISVFVSSKIQSHLDSIGDSQQSTWTVKIHIGSQETILKIDTGVEVTAISEKLYKSLRLPVLQKPSKILKGPGQHPLQAVGQFHEMLHYGQNSSGQQIFVIKDLKSNLLGLPAIAALNLAARLDAAYTTLVKNSFPTVFQGFCNLGEPYTNKLRDNAVPYALFKPRTVLVQTFYQENCVNLTLIATKANSADFDLLLCP